MTTLTRSRWLVTIDEDWGDSRKNKVVDFWYSLEDAQRDATYYRELGRKNVRIIHEVATQTLVEGPKL